ncbi:branched-chain amino acid transport system II carrier protein [Enterococcus nangangensis]|uniref:branched-chain amino acid transport system II carrier protein n=1 Tax=Enterococcus nangangensis TaxID=2559926 RepID=UPI0010F54F6F|nr:branched-chain amino acid transport system II carrier protein [Enterococcus nangangensis]
MTEKKLQFRDYLYVGSLLFGLFFGAGNLIFPVHLGQLAGSNVWWANLGFLITGIGLPFLGVIAIGISRQKGILEVAKRIHPLYGTIFTALLYLVIGPFFALPRLASTSFAIALQPFVPSSTQKLILLLFSVAFFFGAYLFAKRPNKLLDYVGKFLNPLFLLLLFVLILFAFLKPLGSFNVTPTDAAYLTSPLNAGLKEGYNTLDALASLAFGIIIVTTLQQMGVKQPKTIAKDTIKSGFISIVIMGIIYTCLALMGTMSLGQFALSENGGIALAQLADHYLGTLGSILLALIVIIACFKTAIGLITAFSETFHEIFPQISYGKWLIITSVLPAIFANVGLTNIIAGALPVLMFIYPLAITLIFLVLTGPLFKERQCVYVSVTVFTLIAALCDGLNALPLKLQSLPVIQDILALAQHIPLFSIGMSWVVFMPIGLVVGLILAPFFPKKITKEA